MFESRLYTASPRQIQELLISTRVRLRRLLREGRRFRTYQEHARQRERWSLSKLTEYQLQKLHVVLLHAARNVPYYSGLRQFAEEWSRTHDIAGFTARLPVISKKDVLDAGNRLLALGTRGSRIWGSTSGTTGTPLAIAQDLNAICRENAFIWRQLNWAGFQSGEPRAWIRGDLIVPASQTHAPYWRLNRPENMLMLSSYHLSESTAESYLNALKSHAPVLIQAYPSSIAFLARFLQSRDAYFDSTELRSVVTSSETLSEVDRELIQQRFACKVFDWYGSFERVAAIGTCEMGSYHLMNDYSYVEFNPVGGRTYELIGTGFGNLLMPLIRYHTGDTVELPEDSAGCACGREFTVISKVCGRQDDYVVLPDGRKIGRLDHVFKGIAGIAEAQIIQEHIDEIRVLIVPFAKEAMVDLDALRSNVTNRLGSDVRVSIEFVPSIARTANGKFRAVVSRVVLP